MRVIEEKNQIEKEFGFVEFYDNTPKMGWLINYRITRDETSRVFVEMYLVDEHSKNFKIKIQHHPSFLIPIAKDTELSVQEDLERTFRGKIHKFEVVNRIDPAQHNHLNRPPKQFLAVHTNTEDDFSEISKIILGKERGDLDYLPEKIHEHDIPVEVQAATLLKICCGKWYSVSYDGCTYTIHPSDRIAYPDLRIMAFDIETTKPPLKFPNASNDVIMMISVMTESFGELVINRDCVSEDIQEFEYEAKEDMKCVFQISNEKSEEGLLIRFIELMQEHQPHIITTYNGAAFDWPFVEQRALLYGIPLTKTVGIRSANEYYDCPFIMHMDCYRWVKRDSYLPMNSQGLKEVTRIKLGYYPDEIDPEDMVRLAREIPQKMASYSASDAVATYYLYIKYVHPHIFSVSSIIPLPPVQILCKGSGTLCEALLFSEALFTNILVPSRKPTGGLEYYNGHLVESLTYVGGHVESLKAGVFRSDFEHDFDCDPAIIDLIEKNLGILLKTPDNNYSEIVEQLEGVKGKHRQQGMVYHLDVGAMYPNIILTNRMQPIAVVNDDICIHCDFNTKDSKCKRKMQWVSRAEYYPPSRNEINMIENQLNNESFYKWEGEKSEKIPYSQLSLAKREALLKERITEYSKKIYKRIKTTETKKREITVCQKELPFYVDTVRRFRDQRNAVKVCYKRAMKEYDLNPTVENYKMAGVYNSLQIAYKCILNSFYGYVMRTGSRWFSLEMAAAVCHVGGEIIRLAKEFMEKIGIVLELDTDGIWCLVPKNFPSVVVANGQKVPLLANILNYFVCRQFTNDQYHTDTGNGAYEITSANSIEFEIDGPYKTMVVPSSTEENKMVKKRYAIFDFQGKICELKGFELKRRGELTLVKKFQEDLFGHFNDGNTLDECYKSLSDVCNYWLDIIYSEGMGMGDEDVIELFSETRNMSKNIEEYAGRNTNITSTARRLSEFLGEDMMEDKLRCEFIISKYPLNAPTVNRAVPVLIFKHPKKKMYLKKWLKVDITSLKKIIDWEYYKRRFETILQRLVVIPAYFQGLKNPVQRVQVPKWVKSAGNSKLEFSVKMRDIEDLGKAEGAFDFAANKRISTEKTQEMTTDEKTVDFALKAPSTDEKTTVLQIFKNSGKLANFSSRNTAEWTAFCEKSNAIVDIREGVDGMYRILYGNGEFENKIFIREIYLEVGDMQFFRDYKTVKMAYQGDGSLSPLKELVLMNLEEGKYRSTEYARFLAHFSVIKTGGIFPMRFQLAQNFENIAYDTNYAVITSFIYGKKPIYAITTTETVLISEIKGLGIHGILLYSLEEYAAHHLHSILTFVISKSDVSALQFSKIFQNKLLISVDVAQKYALGAITDLLNNQSVIHLKIKEEYHSRIAIATFGNIPVSFVDEQTLDVIFYKELMKNNILPQLWENGFTAVYSVDKATPGYYPSYCVHLECLDALLLSVIDFRCFLDDCIYREYSKNVELMALNSLMKRLILTAISRESSVNSLIKQIPKWVSKASKVISPKLKEILGVLKQSYMTKLMSKLAEAQCEVVASSGTLLIINTNKQDIDGCRMYVEYVNNKLAEFAGFELMKMQTLRVYEKLVFVNSSRYFYKENGEIRCFSDVLPSKASLELYFGKETIAHEEVYDVVSSMGTDSVKLFLEILSYRMNVCGLASNCYRLAGIKNYEDKLVYSPRCVLFCKTCGYENRVGKRCLKCFSLLDRESVNDACMEYLHELCKDQLSAERCCVHCRAVPERRLREYCECGGKLEARCFISEMKELGMFVNTAVFDEEVQRVVSYFEA